MPFWQGRVWREYDFVENCYQFLLLIFGENKVESASIHLLEHFSKYIFIPENTEDNSLYISSSFWIWSHDQTQTMSGTPMNLFGQLLRVDIFEWLFFVVTIRKDFSKRFESARFFIHRYVIFLCDFLTRGISCACIQIIIISGWYLKHHWD